MAQKGLKVCLVEKKPKAEIGEKICGDALGEHHLTFLGLEKPTGGELEAKIDGMKIYSPDEKTVFTVADKDFKGYILNRHLFGQWRLKKSHRQRRTTFRLHHLRSPIIEKGAVAGITAKDMKTGKVSELRSKVVVDATQATSVWSASKLPEELGIDREIENTDVELANREIRELKVQNENTRYCEIYPKPESVPRWLHLDFPKIGHTC
jgi:flavin-dependent dehydrogenase